MPPQRGERKKMNRVNQRKEGCSCSENEKSMRHLSTLLRNVHTVLDNIMAGWIFCPVTINLLLWLLSHWFKSGCWAVGARMFSHFVCWKVKSETSERWQQNAAKNESWHADCRRWLERRMFGLRRNVIGIAPKLPKCKMPSVQNLNLFIAKQSEGNRLHMQLYIRGWLMLMHFAIPGTRKRKRQGSSNKHQSKQL